jgi:DNA-directed RNA polymerase specialized sigma24 family protein
VVKPPFEEMIPAALVEINKRRNGWTLSSISFEDVSQMLLIRAFNKYHTYIPEKGEFSHWINRLITNALTNILRDNLQKFSRPCIQGCQFNLGDNFCSYTKSGLQCVECPLYRKWKKKKEAEFNIKQSLPLETHSQEVNSIQSDFIDIEEAKKMLDEKIELFLTIQEYRIYHLLFTEHRSVEEVGKILKFKKPDGKGSPGYQTIHKARQKIVKVAKRIIMEDGE